MDYNQMSLKMHEENHGKLEVVSKVAINDRDDLSTAYTPGVAEPCRKIHANPADVYKYTCKANTVAVVSDGTAVLGLGDIGPEAAIPVMEGKSVLFKRFAGVDAFPICLDTKDVDEIVETVKRIARWYLMNDGFIVVNLVPLRDEPSGSVSAKNGNRVQIWIDDRSIQNEHRNRR